MKRFLFFILFLLPFLSFGQSGGLVLTTLAGSSGAPPAPTPLEFYNDNITVSDGSANLFVLAPSGYDNYVPSGGWPLVVFFGGDGTSNNNTATNSNQAMSTGDNLTYTHTPDLFGFRMMVSTVVVKVDGTPVAWGRIGGAIVGDGVSGSVTNFDHDDPGASSSPTVSVTFDESQSGSTVVCDYVRTSMLVEGPLRWINYGDSLDNRVIFASAQNVQLNSDFDMDYLTEVIEYIWNNYEINPNRISVAGISRGGRMVMESAGVLPNRYRFWIDESTGVVYTSDDTGRVESGIASLVTGTASYGASYTPLNYDEVGVAHVHGTGDATLTNFTYSIASQFSGNNEPPYVLNIPGVGHTNVVWDEQCYKREFRQGGATGSLDPAPWDWVDFLLKYSRDSLERATLFVEQVERRRYGTEKDIIDYRHAARQVAALPSSSEKTALEGRLSTVKSAIDNGGTRWVINFHSAGNDESGNYVNFASSTAGTTVSNIVDFDGNTTTLDIELDTDPGVGMAAITDSRRSHTGGFSLTANNSGLGLSGFPLGRFLLTDLPTGTYTVRFYHNSGVAGYGTAQTFYVDLNSETTQTYSITNTLIGYTEYTGVPHTALADFDVASTSGNPQLTIMEIYKHP